MDGRLLAALVAGALGSCATPAEVAAPPADDDAWCTDVDRHVLEQLDGRQRSGPIVAHFRSGDLPDEVLQADIAANREDFDILQDKLRMRYDGTVHIFLYRDKEDMLATTEGDSDIAFSTGTRSIHQLHDFRGVHELTHIFALQFPGNADGAGPDLFLTEGLATAMAESDQGVPVHAWAAMYQRLGRLPELPALRAEFMGTAPKGVHPYHVAASFVLYLVERFGIEAVKRWYENSTEAGLELGVPFPRLDRDWRAFLAALPVEPAHASHVRARFGRELEPMPEDWATACSTRLFDGGSLALLEPDEHDRWVLRDGLLVGTHDGPWTAIHSRTTFGPDVGLRARFRLVSGDAVQLRLGRANSLEGQAIFARWATYLSVGEGFSGEEKVKVPEGVWCEAVFTNVGGRGRLFLDGVPVLDVEDALPRQPGRVGLAVERGVLEVVEMVVFDP